MKHYVYVSDSKINMLFQQIPVNFLSSWSAELIINLPFVKATVKENVSERDRYYKLTAVLAFLDNERMIGALDSGKPYVRGALKMKWGLYEKTSFVFFSGKQDETIVGLGGSLGHVIGSEQAAPLTRSSWGSACVGMERSLSAELDISLLASRVEQDDAKLNLEDASNRGLVDIVGRASRLIDAPRAAFEFVALRLADGGFEHFNVVVGTPLYVAYAL